MLHRRLVASPRLDAAPVLVALLALAGCPSFDPPTCESEGYACFVGEYSDLLGAAVEGVQLCPRDLDLDCATTDDDGGFAIPGLPPDTDVAVTARHDDFVDVLFPQNTAWDWYAWNKVGVSRWVMNTHAERIDAELDPERGHLLFLVWEGLNLDGEDTPRVSGVTAQLDGGQLFYADAVGLASRNAAATTSSGSGGALNLEPGVAQLRLDAPAGPCVEHSFSWAFEPGEPIPVPIEAGFVTAIDVVCPTEESR